MKTTRLRPALVYPLWLLACGPAASLAGSPTPPKKYVCPPCPVACHDVAYDQPGTCPVCGMTLIDASTVRHVAILVWDGVELLDFAGPAEVFAAAQMGDQRAYNVVTVALKPGPVTSQGFLKIEPNYTIDNCPTPSVLVIPGGGLDSIINDRKAIAWVRSTSNKTDMIISVCTGAFILAEAGLLDDLEATTWHGAIAELRREVPRTKVHDDRRFVDNGDVITAAGVSAGIDASLHALAKLTGADVARKTARYMEYDWRPALTTQERRAAVSSRIARDPDSVIAELEQALRAGTMDAAEVLADEQWFALHEIARFRELIRRSATRSEATLITATEPGERMEVSGTIRDSDGKPLGGASIYVYHTNSKGCYSSSGGNTATMGDALNPRLFAYLRTAQDGRYKFKTIRPGPYPEEGPPAHIHYEVEAYRHAKRVTELMFEGDPRLTEEAREAFVRDGFIISPVTRGEDGLLRCTCDITLSRS